ncbi:helix-turn-helix domain-containing protein [Actinomadura luteofluorescens]|uniref:helix-turn-helix domain-containing protein n=1 Tax=Actinomadura luteofluorescens TaxID=46163 RepID=UPI003D942FAC
MVQRTFYALPNEAPSEAPAWEPAPDDVHTLKYGYNLADLDLLTRAAVRRVVGMRGDYRDRYETAWSAVAEHLYARETPPAPFDLIDAGRDALRRHVVDVMHHHGRRRATEPGGGTEPMPRYGLYWDWVGWRPDPAHILERVAVWQIWEDLTDRDRAVLAPLTAGLSQRDAARALGMQRAAYVMALRIARRHFLDRWHEGEDVPGQWGRSSRSGETTYRSAMLARKLRTTATLPKPKCAKASTYQSGCRCLPCTTAATQKTSTRRRARTGATQRRFLGDVDRARIVELSAAGLTVDQIMAETGWSRPTVNNVRRAARERGQL